MNTDKAKANVILETPVGSALYGTMTSTSDTDVVGVFMPWEELVFGFDRMEEVDLSVSSKTEDGKNDQNAVDYKLYEFRKFCKLALENNPNILEILFSPIAAIYNDNQKYGIGSELFAARKVFLHAGLKQRFLGYAFSQKHKMVIRTENFYALENALDYFVTKYQSEDDQATRLYDVDHNLPFLSFNKDFCVVGDLNLLQSLKIHSVISTLKDRLSKVTSRKTLMTKYGYDVKFASHLVRLMLEGIELLTTGDLQFPLSFRGLILDIKLGKYNMPEVLEMADAYEKEVERLAINTKLPAKPRYNDIQALVIRLLKKRLAGS